MRKQGRADALWIIVLTFTVYPVPQSLLNFTYKYSAFKNNITTLSFLFNLGQMI